MHDMTINDTGVTGRLGPVHHGRPVRAVDAGQPRPVGGSVLPQTVVEEPIVADLAKLERLREGLVSFARSIDRDLRFRVDAASGRTVVTVVDGETQEVIRQIPSEELLRMAQVHATTRALLFDREV